MTPKIHTAVKDANDREVPTLQAVEKGVGAHGKPEVSLANLVASPASPCPGNLRGEGVADRPYVTLRLGHTPAFHGEGPDVVEVAERGGGKARLQSRSAEARLPAM